MAFPQVINSATSGATATSLSVTMPASLVAGRLLLMFSSYSIGANPSPSGWTQLFSLSRSDGSVSIGAHIKIATGSDTATISIGVSTNIAAIVYQIDAWSGSLSEVLAAVSANNITTVDPPNLAVPLADDYLWFAMAHSIANLTAAPTNYTDYLERVQGTSQLATARRERNAASEDPGAFVGTATNPLTGTVAVPPPEVFGDITFAGSGAIATSATNPAVDYPSGISAGDLLVLLVGQKPATAGTGGITDPSGWGSPVAASLAQGGYGATLGADTGDTNLWAYTKVATGSESGSLTVTMSDNNVAWGQMYRLTSAVRSAWDVAGATGSDSSAGSVSVTFGSDPGITTEDYVLGALCIPTDVTTPSQFSAQAFSATGVTFGTVKEISEPDSATGNDIGGMLCRARVLSGTSSAAPVMTATAGGTTTNVRGPAAFLRVRRITGGSTTGGSFIPWFA